MENSHLVQDDWELLSSDEVRSRSNSDSLNNSASAGSRSDSDQHHAGASGGGHGGANGESIVRDKKVQNGGPSGSDFFSKYDTDIASLKNKVETLDKSSR